MYRIQYTNVHSILALTVLIGEFAGDVERICRQRAETAALVRDQLSWHPYCYCFNLKILTHINRL